MHYYQKAKVSPNLYIATSLSFLKAPDNRLLDWDGLTDISGKRFQVIIDDFELHILRHQIEPELYKRYMNKLLHTPINYYFNRFELFQHNLQNVSLHLKGGFSTDRRMRQYRSPDAQFPGRKCCRKCYGGRRKK